MILFTTLGFEEKYLLREIFRRGIKDKTLVYVLVPQEAHEKTEKAFALIKETLAKLDVRVELEKIPVPIQNPFVAVSKLRRIFRQVKDPEVYFNLSGGQRLLIFCVIAAISSLSMKAKISIESEDGTLYVEVPSEILMDFGLDEIELKVLEMLEGKAVKLREIIAQSGVSRVTLWRKMKRLKKLGLIEEGERKMISLTSLGYSKL